MIDTPEALYSLSVVNDADALVKAIHRLATAIEQNTLAILDQRLAPLLPAQTSHTSPPPNVQPFAPLPAVRTVANTPACPTHGPDGVKVSTKAGVAFFCSRKFDNGKFCDFVVRK